MIKAGIIGGAGYTAGELIRILMNHPEVEITAIQSTSNAGNPISDVHTDLAGETDLKFCEDIPQSGVDVVFLCMGHGKSKALLAKSTFDAKVKIIDLSHDFRLKAEGNDFVYGLPELSRDTIRSAKHLANPGCFATAIQLGLLPLASKGLLNEIHTQAITGSTGAGQAPTDTTHFSWRNNNISVYKAFEHQHEGEIMQSLQSLQPQFNAPFNFVPMRGAFSRGILASTYLNCSLTENEAFDLYNEYYNNHPFVHISNTNIDVKQVVNTNKCLIYLEKHGDKLLVISIIDNLIKGASGQAVQNMNLMFGLEETTGLRLKPVAF